MKGNPTSKTIIYKHYSVNGTPLLCSNASFVTLDISFNDDLPNRIYRYVFDLHFSKSYNVKIYLFGECGGVGCNAGTLYEKWSSNNNTEVEQRPMLGGYFHRGSGKNINFSGEFRHYGDHLTNFGVSYAFNGNGNNYNKFLRQRLDKVSYEQKLLGYEHDVDF